MLAFAERLGWRIQKHDEAAVQQFCEEVCVKRHVLKMMTTTTFRVGKEEDMDGDLPIDLDLGNVLLCCN
ncbi:hypothetical protein E2562_009732 [Oryza meyeriana var. granulata]|uniref:Uncharacterized protein n=1 Tax=Oryza meyeriana var. granulata TaxID=110450 RepID=A0A6G1D223_9ORYZ|nr:hypothetical protein E2562_009732 [Oryza meyeriana var. granulata]